jgi:hypothetical protein
MALIRSREALVSCRTQLVNLVLYVLVIGALSYVAINWGVKLGRWFYFEVVVPERGWIGMSGLILLLGVAAGMALVLVLMWSVGRRFDPIARWLGPLKRRFRRRGGRP